jgi:hypothetical protein
MTRKILWWIRKNSVGSHHGPFSKNNPTISGIATSRGVFVRFSLRSCWIFESLECVTPCRLVNTFRPFKLWYCHHLQVEAIEELTPLGLETSKIICAMTQHNVREDISLARSLRERQMPLYNMHLCIRKGPNRQQYCRPWKLLQL